MTPIFEFNEHTEVEAFWFVHWPQTDWMAAVYRDGPEAPWQSTYRFRYYASEDDPHDPQDRKSAYHIKLTDNSRFELLMSAMETAARELAKTTHGRYHKVIVRGSAEKAHRLMRDLPWVHSRILAPEPKEVQ
jgi:hypothetical protein